MKLKRKMKAMFTSRSLRQIVKKGAVTFVAVVILAGLLVGCSKSNSAAPQAAEESGAAAADHVMSDTFTAANGETKVYTTASNDNKGQTDANQPAEQTKSSTAVDNTVPANMTPSIGAEGVDGFNRKLIYRANLVMEVKDYAKAQTELRDLVAVSGAYILQFSENTNNHERGGNFTIKVGAKGFVSLLDGIEKISPTKQRNIQGSDVTEEYVDLSSRLKAKEAVEARLLAFMEKAAKTDELLAFSNELAKVQEDIEKLKGRMRYLDQNVSYSTVELRIYQKQDGIGGVSDDSLAGDMKNALRSSLKAMMAVVKGLLVFFAGALPVIVILVLAAIPFFYYRKKQKQKLALLREQIKHSNSENEQA